MTAAGAAGSAAREWRRVRAWPRRASTAGAATRTGVGAGVAADGTRAVGRRRQARNGRRRRGARTGAAAGDVPGRRDVRGRGATAEGDGRGRGRGGHRGHRSRRQAGAAGNAAPRWAAAGGTTAIPTLTASATSAKASSGHGRGAGPPRRARFTGVAAVDAARPPRAAGFELPPPLAASASTWLEQVREVLGAPLRVHLEARLDGVAHVARQVGPQVAQQAGLLAIRSPGRTGSRSRGRRR